jgi:Sulfatase-modifying factor enzyme 1
VTVRARWWVAALAAAAAAVLAVALASRLGAEGELECDGRFHVAGARCCPGAAKEDLCVASPDVPARQVLVPAASVDLNAADWEAEGRVAPRTVRAGAFWIDACEITVGRVCRDVRDLCEERFARELAAGDMARAASGLTKDEASRICAASGGRLPRDDEWLAAALSGRAARYPWGETGAVCRRAAWGLVAGPCSRGARGPDTVGAHAAGDTALGVHDMAGNVAERMGDRPFARGGSWASALATELRLWSELPVADGARDPRVGARCVYDQQPPQTP